MKKRDLTIPILIIWGIIFIIFILVYVVHALIAN